MHNAIVERPVVRPVLSTFLVILVLSLLGFFGYYYGFLGFIYRVMMPEVFSNYPLVILSVLFGTAAFFSPCALSVLPTYVSHFLTLPEAPTRTDRVWQSLKLGLIGAFGIIAVNLVIGVIIALLGAATPFAKDPREDIALILAVRVIAGVLIMFLGVITVTGKSIPFIARLSGFTLNTVPRSIFSYGVLYNAAAIGCTGPILLGLMLYAFNLGQFSLAFFSFLIFSLTMGLWMIVLTLFTSLFKGLFLKRFAAFGHHIKTVSGLIMILLGLAVVLLTLEGNRIFVQIFFPFLK